MKTKFYTRLFVIFMLTSMMVSSGLILNQKIQCVNTATMRYARVVITKVTVVTDLPNGDYTLKVGIEWKRIFGSYRSVFTTSDSQYEDYGVEWYTHSETIEGGPYSAGETYDNDVNTHYVYTVDLDEAGYEYYVEFKLQKWLTIETEAFYLGSTDNDYNTLYETCNVWYSKFGAYLKFEYKFQLST